MKAINEADIILQIKKYGALDSFRYGTDTFFDALSVARKYNIEVDEIEQEILATDIGLLDTYENEIVPLDMPMPEEAVFQCDAATYKGKEVKLNTPMKGDVKKFKVFVKKGDKVVKVNFGLSVTRKDLENPEKRKAFVARHKCDSITDKTTPAYWACSTTRWFHKLFGGDPIGARYW